MKVCVIIPTYNSADLTSKTIELLKKQTLVPDIIVVDGGSTKNDAAILRQRFPDITVLRFDEDLGGAGSYYEGGKFAMRKGYDVLIFSDNDAFPVSENLIEKITKTLMKNKKVGICGPVIIYSPNAGKTGYILPRTHPLIYCGVRKDVVEKVGFPDKNFFIWFDDVEYSLRVKKAGYLVVNLPDIMYSHPIKNPFVPYHPRHYYYCRNLLYLRKKAGLIYIKHVFTECFSTLMMGYMASTSMPRYLLFRAIMDFYHNRMGKARLDKFKLNRRLEEFPLSAIKNKMTIITSDLELRQYLKEVASIYPEQIFFRTSPRALLSIGSILRNLKNKIPVLTTPAGILVSVFLRDIYFLQSVEDKLYKLNGKHKIIAMLFYGFVSLVLTLFIVLTSPFVKINPIDR
ncbi:MAG: glycosyltransferase [Candidatus Korarchaeota archaeon]